MSIKRVKRLIDGDRREVFVYDIRLGGRRVRTPRGEYFTSRLEAKAAADAIRTDYRRGQYKFPSDRSLVSLSDVRDGFISHLKRARRHPTYIAHCKYAFTLLEEVVSLETPVSKLATKHLSLLIEKCEEKGTKRSTIFNYLVRLRTALKWATENIEGLKDLRLPKNPAEIRAPRYTGRQIFSAKDQDAILFELRSDSPPQFRSARFLAADAFEIALLTAMRINEILSLQRADVNLERAPGYPLGFVIVRSTKTGDRAHDQTDDRIIPLSGRAHALLEERVKDSRSKYLFAAADRPMTASTIRRVVESAAARAKVPFGRKEGGLSFHDTRHTAITNMLQAGIDLATVMEIAGHRSAKTTLGYTHATAESKLRAVSALCVRQKSNEEGPTEYKRPPLTTPDRKASKAKSGN